jgi:hypothetical protein
MRILAIMAGILGVSDSGHNHGRLQVLRHDPKQQAPDPSPTLSSTNTPAHPGAGGQYGTGQRPSARSLQPFAGLRAASGIGAGVLRERRAKINRVIDAAQNERIDDSGSVKMTAVSVK